MKILKPIMRILGLLILLIVILNFLNPQENQNNIISTENIEQKELNPYKDTNLNSLISNGSYLIKEAGIVLKLPKNLRMGKEGNELVLMEDKREDLCYIILISTDRYYLSPYEAYKSFSEIKNDLTYIFNNKEYKTSLFDFSGGLETVNLTDKQAILEEEDVILFGGEVITTAFINFTLDGRAFSIGMGVKNNFVDVNKLIKLSEFIYPICYTGNLNPFKCQTQKISFEGREFTLPERFIKNYEDRKVCAYQPIVCSDDPFRTTSIVLLSTERNPDSLGSIDEDVIEQEKIVSKILGIKKIENLSIITPVEKFNLNNQDFFETRVKIQSQNLIYEGELLRFFLGNKTLTILLTAQSGIASVYLNQLKNLIIHGGGN